MNSNRFFFTTAACLDWKFCCCCVTVLKYSKFINATLKSYLLISIFKTGLYLSLEMLDLGTTKKTDAIPFAKDLQVYLYGVPLGPSSSL